MFVRNPDCLALEAVDFTDSAPVRARSAPNPPQLVNARSHEACDLDDVVCLLAPRSKTAAGRTYALATALQAWMLRAATARRRPRAYHRKRPHEPTMNAQSALDFAAEVNARFQHASNPGAYRVLPLQASHDGLCCPRHRKALYAALVALAVAVPVYAYEPALPRIGLEVTVPQRYAAIAPADDVRVVRILKYGLRNATALFGQHSSQASARNVATMTAGIRN